LSWFWEMIFKKTSGSVSISFLKSLGR